MKIVVGISGGIAAYKALSLISALRKIGYEVKVIATPDAMKFVTKDALISISGGEYYETEPGKSIHIDLAKWCDGMIIVPTTANTLAKLTYGIADNLLTTTFLALPKEKHKLIALAMNNHMYANPVTQANISQLNDIFPRLRMIHPIEGLLACGDTGTGKLQNTRTIVQEIQNIFYSKDPWVFPLMAMKKLGPTNDSFSYLDYNWGREVEVPIHPHCGSFGIRRKFDVHKGVDLYAPVGASVHAVEDGVVVEIAPFTGKAAGCAWWEDTMGIYIKGKSGIVVYGEVTPFPLLKAGTKVTAGTKIAEVARVLKRDNKRPTSMLHIELHEPETLHTGTWKIGKRQPKGLLDITQYLLNSKQYGTT